MSQRYTIDQRVWSAIWYEERKSVTDVCRRYRSRFGRNTQAPQRALIIRWHENLFQHGNVLHRISGSGRPLSVCTEENKEAVATAFTRSPKKSIRRASSEMNMSISSICRMLHDSGFRAYKMKILHALQPEDIDRRIEFCEWGMQMVQDEPSFLGNLIFSDEAIFHLTGHVNKQNCRIWGTEEPSDVFEKPLHSEKVVVWLAMWSGGLIGPFFFTSTVTGESYLEMLQTFFWPTIANFDNLEDIWFMQDGAPPHFATSVRKWLDEHFPGKWIGRRGAIDWPPRSPDLTPLDFYVWSHLKQLVFASNPRTVSDLKAKIREGVQAINDTQGLMTKVMASFHHRLHVCLQNQGGHIEQLKDCHLNG